MLERLALAAARRASLLAEGTDALRIVDGKGDGFPNLEIDDFAGRWLVQTRDGRVPDWLRESTIPRSIYWKNLGKKTSPRWIAGERVERAFVVCERRLRYWIDFQAGYSQGIFLDQRDNRRALSAIAAGRTVLNCFAYTCAFGVAAASGGGSTINLDLSRRSLEWGRRNYVLNGLEPEDHDFIYGDVSRWLNRFARKGRRFDVVILDPPTFSRNAKGAVFRVERDFGALVALAARVLEPGGRIFCSTNQRSMTGRDFERLVLGELSNAHRWRLERTAMPEDFTGEHYLKAGWLTRSE